MTTRDIEAHLHEIYGASVGRDTISRVTAAVLDDARKCQQRPLQAVYPIVYLDAMIIKITDAQLAAVKLTGDPFHPDWNYTINPRGH